MTTHQLIEAAKKAVEAGDLDLAKSLATQAKLLKSITDVDPQEAATPDTSALEEQVKALSAKLAAIESEPPVASSVVVTRDETDKKAAQPFRTLGQQLKAVADAALYPHMMDDRLKAQKAVTGTGETVPSDGGFLVQQDFALALFSIEHNAGAIASRCRRIPVGANANGLTMNAVDETSRATGSRWGGIRGYWVAEGGTITASQPTFRRMEWNLQKLAAAVYATDELLADTTALEAVITEGVREELEFLLDNAVMRGTGAGQPQGVLNSGSLISVAKETGQAATTLVYENILKMWSRMHSRSRLSPNCFWAINQDVEPQLFSMDAPIGTGGVPVYLPPGGLSSSPYGALMGRPVIATEFNSTLGTVGDIMLLDLGQYLLVEKGGVESASSMHVQFLTDQMVYRFIYRVDGKTLWSSALTPSQGTNTQSPFIALATRS